MAGSRFTCVKMADDVDACDDVDCARRWGAGVWPVRRAGAALPLRGGELIMSCFDRVRLRMGYGMSAAAPVCYALALPLARA